MPDSHKNFGKYLSVLESYLLFSTVKKHLNLLAKMTQFALIRRSFDNLTLRRVLAVIALLRHPVS